MMYIRGTKSEVIKVFRASNPKTMATMSRDRYGSVSVIILVKGKPALNGHVNLHWKTKVEEFYSV